MTFDSEEHRQMVRELLERASFPAPIARKVVELLDAVESATVPVKPTEEKK